MRRVICEYKGKEYSSIKELAQATNHAERSISKWLLTCKTQEEFEKKVDKKRGSYIYKGKEYRIKELIKICKVTETNFYLRLGLGWSVEEAVDTPHMGLGGVRIKRC